MDQKDQSGVWLTLQQNTEVVEERLRIIGLIKQLVESHALVQVTLPGNNESYNSAVIAIDTDRNTLTLDELAPNDGNDRLKLTRHCSVYGRVKGVGIYFEVDIDEIGSEQGVALYRAAIPGLVFYGQKRSHYRVHVGLGISAPLVLGDAPGDGLSQGQLRDLSLGGLGAAFPLTAPIRVGDTFARCVVELPGIGSMECGLEVRFAQRDEARRELVVGARFTRLNAQQERAIQRCVYALEREGLRRRPDR